MYESSVYVLISFFNLQFAYQNDLINKTMLATADGMYAVCKGESIHSHFMHTHTHTYIHTLHMCSGYAVSI